MIFLLIQAILFISIQILFDSVQFHFYEIYFPFYFVSRVTEWSQRCVHFQIFNFIVCDVKWNEIDSFEFEFIVVCAGHDFSSRVLTTVDWR